MQIQTYVALLRGVNLGSRNKVAMADLRGLVEGLGCEDVATYVQSGNVVFKSKAAASGLAGRIEKQIADELGLTVSVVVRSKAQLAKIVAGNPFAKRSDDATKLHVTFLAKKPAAANVKALEPERFPREELRVSGTEVYLHYPDGYGRSKLTNAYLEKKLGVAATNRNWRTVTKLAELAGA
jgi:uncharacterized protein (DUF1697 family)